MNSLLLFAVVVCLSTVFAQGPYNNGCSYLSDPANGGVSVLYNVAIYSCNRGYQLRGDAKRTCVYNEWKGTEPTCLPVCPVLGDPRNGGVSVSAYGTTATYSCDRGYKLEGNKQRTCSYGVWSGSEPHCKKECPKLSDPAYGEVTVAYDVATYSCQYGYELKGDKKRTCSYGVWSGSEPCCEKLCPELANLTNGEVTVAYNGTTGSCRYGGVATYSCQYGYKLKGDKRRTCSYGVWSGSEPCCEKLCPKLGNPANGEVTVAYNGATGSCRYGGVATYSCRSGYKLKGNRKRTCSYGRWSGSQPRCEKLCPELRDPAHGEVNVAYNVATYSCDRGYQLKGNKWRTCSYGVWSGSRPECVCPKLSDPAYGEVTVAYDVATYSCQYGYKLKGSKKRTCSYGVWSGSEPCCEKLCPELANLTNGEVTVAYNGTTGSCRYGGVATYSCQYGYKLKGDKRRTCSYGVWSGSEPCCEKLCPKLANLTNGEVTVAYNGANGSCRYGGVATYSCEYGYKLKGDKRRTCSYGVWSGSEPCCEKLCPKLANLTNGEVTVAYNGANGSCRYGGVATYSCEYGYKLKGDKRRTCSYGVWSGSEPCCEKLCPKLGNPANGEVTVAYNGATGSCRYGGVATYSCRSGYKLKGNRKRTCSYGRWSGSQPRCEKLCPELRDPAHGEVNVAYNVATYSCDRGYQLKGSNRRTCSYGVWSGSRPECVCPKLSDPAYGEVTVAYDVATYSCQYGYKLKGSKKRTCSYGVWSGSQPRCEKLCPKLSDPAYGEVDVAYNVATYSCQYGYKLKGDEQRTCSNGVWSGSEPSCFKLCRTLANPRYGKVRASYNSAFYLCNSGYELKGNVWRVCKNGEWTGEEPYCRRKCPKLTDPAHGEVTVVYDVANYSCDYGYYLKGNENRNCSYGVWSGSQPNCEKLCPELSSPAYGTVTVGYNVATYSCQYGYKLKGDKKRTCSYGRWTGSQPRCEKLCPELRDPAHGEVNVAYNVAIYSCDRGYQLKGSNRRTCEYGVWSGSQPECVCPKLSNPAYGEVTVAYDVATYSCQYGYKLKGNKKRSCSYGVWSGSQPNCEKLCPELSSPAYGEVTVGYNVATYSCQYGYKLKGDKKRTCSYGVWSGSEPSCVKECRQLANPAYGQVSITYNEATYSCDYGYKLNGNKKRTCSAYGVWSGSEPSCDESCDELVNPTYGSVQVSGDTAIYRCIYGYRLVGSKTRTCVYGSWDGYQPHCVKDCLYPGSPRYGHAEVENDRVTYHCDKGYVLQGQKYRDCRDGRWRGQEPRCIISYN
ncbi:sushi, von Willebrand factor type A, EGF and pentraxin domain-containing protein 1-like isoform X2 [Corticium candelabrum]|uniref:sushi, von Willebrand factor type A, EGF and pentraxin domain-containing protein 1-like isoform X2 n=1 Tax=Corticium candelabrum TaxID=121492 RepID=UPI002E2688A9|nr:sushi, von Willebrand factor type A, EGF and pentraxin domain-containing protein 1-like isoform X2 [Corticium candelabrum]